LRYVKTEFWNVANQARKTLRDFSRASTIVLQLVELHGHSSKEILLDRGVKYAAEAEELLTELEESSISIPSELQMDWDKTVNATLTFLYRMQKELPSDRSWDAFTQICWKLIAYGQLFRAPRWRWWKKRKLVQQILYLNEVTLPPP
jgi:hypothetical protein